MIYQDFDLLIDRIGEKLRAQVLNSPAGQATAEFCLPFSDDKLENFLLRLGRTRPQTRRVESQEMNTAKTFGAALFDAVFSGDVKACFRSSIDEARRQNAGLRIRLRLGDPSVVDLPWEFLYNRAVNRFIALSIHTPLVRYMDLPERIQPIPVKPPIRVLVMISSPSDFPPLDVEGEWARLNEALADRVAAGQLAIERLEAASLEALQRRLRRQTYHIFHFIGHGEFDQAQQEGVLVLEAENKRGHKVDSQFLGMLLHDHESLRVAILNACEGARTSRTDPFAGSAQSLVQQGIPAVIAMQFEIADDVASRFAHEFYGALADGYPIDAALTEARKSIFAAGREVEWGTPVLYLRAPDGRIFDIQAVKPQPDGTSLKRIDSANHSPANVPAHDVVAAAHAAFAGGQRLQALEMLRRFEPPSREIADALRNLTIEHQRLIDEGRRTVGENLEGHLKAAAVLLANGQLTEAWREACDALQVDGTDKRAIALEGRIRKVLDDQAARDFARGQEEAGRAGAERGRDTERADALTRSRLAIENSVASGDLDHAEEELKRIDESYAAGAEFADLRAHVLDLRHRVVLRQDQLADDVIAQARQEFAETPAAAVERLERFSPPHPRVTAALRELRDWIAEQNERALREAERRGEEARERQRNKEQRRRDLQQAVERIRGYLDREELTEAAAALAAAEATFGPASIFEEFRARVKVAERRLQHDDAVRSAIAHGRNLAAAGDVAGAVRKLETFGPGHPEVDAVLEALRQEQRRLSRRLSPAGFRAAVAAAAPPRVLLAAAVAIVAVAAALWLGPGVVARWKQPGVSPPAAPPGVGERNRPRAPDATDVRPPTSPAAAATAPAPADTTSVSPGQPAGATTEATAIRPEPTAVPPAPEAAPPPSPVKPAASNERLVADRNRIRAHLAKRETEQALSTLMGALDYAPRDAGLRSVGVKVVEQARDRAARERSRALAHGASGLGKFKQAESLAERAGSLSRGGDAGATARAYLAAAALFASCVTGAPAVVQARPVPRPFEGPAPAAETSSSSSTGPGPAVTPAVTEPPPPRPPASPPSVDPVIEAYAEAMSRGDRAALLAAYPTAPEAVLSALEKKGADYNMRIRITRTASDATNRQHVSVVVFHEFTRSDQKERSENQILVLEPKGDSWLIVQILRR